MSRFKVTDNASGKPGIWRERFPHHEFSADEIAYLNQRYGGANFRWQIPGTLLGLMALIWLIWIAFSHANPEIRYSLLSFAPSPISESAIKNTYAIDIRYEIQRRHPDREISCQLIARDIDKNVVGEIIDRIPASTQNRLIRTVEIPARITPVNAAVIDCR